MKNKLMFIGLSALTAGSAVHAGLQGAVWKNGVVHINRSTALVPMVYGQALAKLDKIAAGSVNPGIAINFGDITEITYPRPVLRTGESAVKFYGNKYGWKQAFAQAFAPLAGLFGIAAADSIESTVPVVANDIVTKTVTNNVLSNMQQPVVPATLTYTDRVKALAVSTGMNLKNLGASAYANTWGKELGYFKHDGKVATTATAVTVAGLCVAYKKGYFSKLNPFGKAAVVPTPAVQEVPTIEEKSTVQQTSAVETPVTQQAQIVVTTPVETPVTQQAPIVVTTPVETPVVKQAPTVVAPVAGSVVKKTPMVRKYRTN
ncbi:MAG TPA: hypothetical protein VLG50_00320 [Candidatus Saccharimonadales bacterium]|nr:hypothetical protein [Candidatus Saccharimonadales bacterium]